MDDPSTSEVAAHAGATYSQIDRWISAGLIPGQNTLRPAWRRQWSPEQIKRVKVLARAARLLTLNQAAAFLERLDEILEPLQSEEGPGPNPFALLQRLKDAITQP